MKKKKPQTILSFFSKSTADKELQIHVSVQDPNNAPSTLRTKNLIKCLPKQQKHPNCPLKTVQISLVDHSLLNKNNGK